MSPTRTAAAVGHRSGQGHLARHGAGGHGAGGRGGECRRSRRVRRLRDLQRVYVVDARTMKVLAQIPTRQASARDLPLARQSPRLCDRRVRRVAHGVQHRRLQGRQDHPISAIRRSCVPWASPPRTAAGTCTSPPGGSARCWRSTRESGGSSAPSKGRRAPLGRGPEPRREKAYTANGPSGDVSIVDLSSGRVEGQIAVGGSPWGIVAAGH